MIEARRLYGRHHVGRLQASITNQVRLRLIPYNRRLVDASKQRGWSQKELAMLVGVQVSLISAVETLRIIPHMQLQDEIAGALDMDRESLFSDPLIEAQREGVFDNRVVEMSEPHLKWLTQTRKAEVLSGPPAPEELAIRGLLEERVEEVLRALRLKEQLVLRKRFGLDGDGEKTLEKVGQEMGFTRNWVGQIEAKALRHLRHPSRSQKLKDLV